MSLLGFLFKKKSEWQERFSVELRGTPPSSIDRKTFSEAVFRVHGDMNMSVAVNMIVTGDQFSIFLYNDDGLRADEFMNKLRLYLEEPCMSCHRHDVAIEINPFALNPP